ncbi:MAG: ABC transporter ATP-binding protein [Parasporobacterium sp.]|nr:ABC transporter ATP-binding protein [Parasporobacterium sp.]
MKLLEIRDLTVQYSEKPVIDHVSFSLEEGQWLMIVGPNGAGKSTIVRSISGQLPYTGEILFREQEIRRMKSAQLARHIGVLAQNHAVGYDFTVREIVNLGRYAHRSGALKGESETDYQAVQKAIRDTGLKELESKSVLHLSGGEVQRTFLAQLFAQNPDIMILDEPANHLDLVYQKQVFEMISRWIREPGRAVISVVHDLSLARAYGTHCLLLDLGDGAIYGTAQEVLTSEHLDAVYEMDVYAWMRQMLGQWN